MAGTKHHTGLIIGIVAAIIVAGGAIWWFFFHKKGSVQGSGGSDGSGAGGGSGTPGAGGRSSSLITRGPQPSSTNPQLTIINGQTCSMYGYTGNQTPLYNCGGAIMDKNGNTYGHI